MKVVWVPWVDAAAARRRIAGSGAVFADHGRMELSVGMGADGWLVRTQLPVSCVALALASTVLADARALRSATAADPRDEYVWVEDVFMATQVACAAGEFGAGFTGSPQAELLARLIVDRAGVPADCRHPQAVLGPLLAALLGDLSLIRASGALLR